MCAIVVMLTLFHKRQRLKRYQEIREFYDEQVEYVLLSVSLTRRELMVRLCRLRRSLAALHAAAADRYDEKGRYD